MPVSGPVSTEDAKARLREADVNLEVVSWVERRPFTTMLVAAAAGGVAAQIPPNMLRLVLDVIVEVVDSLEGGQPTS